MKLTRLRLDFVQPCKEGPEGESCGFHGAGEEAGFYEQNEICSDAIMGIILPYEEVSQIIEKRLREDAYDKLICDILCESENRQ